MKKKRMYVIPFLTFCIMIVGCGNQTEKKDNQPIHAVEVENASAYVETYAGTIPCADCEGIEMVLRISADYQHFEITRTYKGKDGEPSVDKGKMNTERGFENDKNATVFILNPDKEERYQSYLVRYSKDSSKIHMLSMDKKRIVSKLNYTLMKQ